MKIVPLEVSAGAFSCVFLRGVGGGKAARDGGAARPLWRLARLFMAVPWRECPQPDTGSHLPARKDRVRALAQTQSRVRGLDGED